MTATTEPDRRELILERLKAVYESVDGVKKAYRNRLDIPESQLPALAILDADESNDDQVPDGIGRRAGLAPIVVTMTPESYIIGAAKSDKIGSDLNAFRIKLIKAVLGDETLLSLCKDGDIRYMGFATGLAAGRSMEGEAGISFQFRYVIRPSKL